VKGEDGSEEGKWDGMLGDGGMGKLCCPFFKLLEAVRYVG